MDKPSSRLLFTFSATPQYERFLVRLTKALKAQGRTVTGDPLQLADLALVELGLRHNLIAPKRTAATGGARPGAGRKPKPKAAEK